MNEPLPSSASTTQTTPPTMKALYFRETGSLDNLRVENVEVPRIDINGVKLWFGYAPLQLTRATPKAS